MSLIFSQQQAHRGYLDQVYENSSREAVATLTYDSRGQGEGLSPAVVFGITFTTVPSITTGVELLAGNLVPGKFPNVSVGVYRWTQDSRGLYVGARLFFVVDSGGQAYTLRHTLEFRGTGIKMLAAGLM